MNLQSVKTIYLAEVTRSLRTVLQSIVSPVVSTSLYFVVFGAAIGSRINEVDGISYGAFIVPGLIMLMLLTQSVTTASFGIFFPRFSGTDRKSTRLNSSHVRISYAVFCLKKKKNTK